MVVVLLAVLLGAERSHFSAASAESHEKAFPLSCMSQVSVVGVVRVESHKIR